MAGKWRSVVKTPEQSQQVEQSQKEGYLPWAASHAASGITGTLGGIWGALSQPFDPEQEAAAHAQYYGNPKAGPVDVDYGPNIIPNPFEMAQQAYPRALGRQPETTGEQIIQRAPQEVLGAIVSGGSALAATAGAVAGPLAAKGLKALGAPEWGQKVGDFLAGLGTNVAGNIIAKKIPFRPSTIKKNAQAELETLVGPKGEIQSGLRSDIGFGIKSQPLQVLDTAIAKSPKTSRGILNQVKEALQLTISENGMADMGDLVHARGQIDALWPQIEANGLTGYVKPIRDQINKSLRSSEAAFVNPKYFNNLSISDVGTIIENSKPVVGKLAKAMKPRAWDLLAGKTIAAAKAGVWAILKGTEEVQNIVRFCYNSPGFRKEYMKLVTATSPAQYASQAGKFIDFINKNPKVIEAAPKSGKWRSVVKTS